MTDDHQHKHCLDCGYILEGLPKDRCPECGREFDPGDSRSYLPPTQIPNGLTVLALAGGGWGMLSLFAWLEPHLPRLVAPIPLVIAAGQLMVAIGAITALTVPVRRHTWALVLASVLSIMYLVGCITVAVGVALDD